jgi:hypothetical protein
MRILESGARHTTANKILAAVCGVVLGELMTVRRSETLCMAWRSKLEVVPSFLLARPNSPCLFVCSLGLTELDAFSEHRHLNFYSKVWERGSNCRSEGHLYSCHVDIDHIIVRLESIFPTANSQPSRRMSSDQANSPDSLAMSEARSANDHAPTMAEITQLTQQLLTTANETDTIQECGRAALIILSSDPDMCHEFAYQKLHDVPYKDVKTCWRRLYTDATLWRVLALVDARHNQGNEGDIAKHGGRKWIDDVVKMLDMALILTGAPEREEIIELWFSALKTVELSNDIVVITEADEPERPSKRRKVSPNDPIAALPPNFPATLPAPGPNLQFPILRTPEISMPAFQAKISAISQHTPMIIEGALQHWPALDERPWSRPGYLLDQTLGGRRLVPVEVGKSYTDEGWGQKIITFKEFMQTYMLEQNPDPSAVRTKGYLAQHDLFAQIPSLRADISIPDYCYCTPTPSPHLTHIKPTPKLEEPLLNAWFGPAGTVSPLHTDPYHNILAQVVGYKYVRLYAPEETPKLYPRGTDENGIDMSNTSQIDLDEAMLVYDETPWWKDDGDVDPGELGERKAEFLESFSSFEDAPYVEAVLAPGECLYLPVGWWHYIRSLTPSFSVSFWFN